MKDTSCPSAARSRNMAAIRSVDTKPEMEVRRRVHKAGFRYALHRRDLPGRPDLVFSRYGVVAFVHGCFWHGHVCKEARPPRSNLAYWGPKIAANRVRDMKAARRLRQAGWSIITIRECNIPGGTKRLIRRLATTDE